MADASSLPDLLQGLEEAVLSAERTVEGLPKQEDLLVNI